LYRLTTQPVQRWQTATRQELPPLTGPTARLRALAVSPDGKTVLAAGNDALIHVWDVTQGSRVRTLEGHTDPVSSLSLTADSKRLASAGGGKRIRPWGVASGPVLAGCAPPRSGHTAA